MSIAWRYDIAFHADLVLVPMERHRDAVTALEDAGHEIVGG